MKPAIVQMPTNRSDVFAFEIFGEAQAEDMEFMAETMNDAFDHIDDVKILLRFRPYDGSEVSGAFNTEVIKAQFRALKSVSKYAVVGLPDAAASIIEFFDNLIPVDSRTFDGDKEDEAWAFVGAQPVTGTTAA